jgi:hypothetical protein
MNIVFDAYLVLFSGVLHSSECHILPECQFFLWTVHPCGSCTERSVSTYDRTITTGPIFMKFDIDGI